MTCQHNTAGKAIYFCPECQNFVCKACRLPFEECQCVPKDGDLNEHAT